MNDYSRNGAFSGFISIYRNNLAAGDETGLAALMSILPIGD
jgi:hypothetical protein